MESTIQAAPVISSSHQNRVLDAASSKKRPTGPTDVVAGVEIPVFCYEPRLGPPVGACRMCLVEIEGLPKLQAACTLTAQDGMVVKTTHPEAERVRRAVLDLTLSMLTPSADRDGFGQVGVAAAKHDLPSPGHPAHHRFETDASKSFFVLDREACILCGRCTVACGDVQQIGAISLAGRGHDARVAVFGDGAMASSVCTSCGQCVATCPTGAICAVFPAGSSTTNCVQICTAKSDCRTG